MWSALKFVKLYQQTLFVDPYLILEKRVFPEMKRKLDQQYGIPSPMIGVF